MKWVSTGDGGEGDTAARRLADALDALVTVHEWKRHAALGAPLPPALAARAHRVHSRWC